MIRMIYSGPGWRIFDESALISDCVSLPYRYLIDVDGEAPIYVTGFVVVYSEVARSFAQFVDPATGAVRLLYEPKPIGAITYGTARH